MSGDAAAAVAHAIASGQPIATHSEGMTLTSWGVWIGVLLGSPYAIFKFIQGMAKLWWDRSGSLDQSRRGDMDDMRERIETLEGKVDVANARAASAEDRAHEAENRLSAAMVVIRVLSAKVRAEWPEDPLLQGLSDLIAAATSSDILLAKGFMAVAQAPAAKREEKP